MKTQYVLLLLALSSLFSGCSIGIKPDSGTYPHTTFDAPVSYQEAYRRADSHVRQCRTSTNPLKGSFNVDGNLYTDTRTAVVHINLPSAGTDLEVVDIKATGESSSHVKITVWGRGIWDERELTSARESILSGEILCRWDVKE